MCGRTMQSQTTSLSCDLRIFGVPWQSSWESFITFNPFTPKVIAPEAGIPVSGELGSPSLKIEWERKVSSKKWKQRQEEDCSWGLVSVQGWSKVPHTAEVKCKGPRAFNREGDGILWAGVYLAEIVWECLAKSSKTNSSSGVGELFVRVEFYTLVESAVLVNYF